MDRFYRQFGKRVKAARKAANDGQGLTQAELANQIGLVRSSVANIERGSQQPPVHTVLAIAKALDVRLLELLPQLPSQVEDTDAVRAMRRKGVPADLIEEMAPHLPTGEDDETDDS